MKVLPTPYATTLRVNLSDDDASSHDHTYADRVHFDIRNSTSFPSFKKSSNNNTPAVICGAVVGGLSAGAVAPAVALD